LSEGGKALFYLWFAVAETAVMFVACFHGGVMRLILLQAPSGGGKTTACLRLAACAQNKHLRVGGVVTRPMWQLGHKTALWLHALPHGEARLLAHPAAPATATWGMWRFVPATFRWGRQQLQSLPRVDLLLVDEVGPLELVLRRGLTLDAITAAFHRAQPRLAVVTVRPALAEVLADHWHAFAPQRMAFDTDNRETQIQRLCWEITHAD